MLLSSEDIVKAKEYIEVMQAFIYGKEIEFSKQDEGRWKQVSTPLWDFTSYLYRVKPSEPEV